MRMARRVIVCLLSLCAAAGLWAQQPKPAEGSVDSSVTVMGRDDSLIDVPPPGPPDSGPEQASLDRMLADTLDSAPSSPVVPPLSPPVAEISLPPRGVLFLPVESGRTPQ